MLARQVHGFVVLDLQIVIVDAVNGKRILRGARRLPFSHVWEKGLGVEGLLFDHALQTLHRRLNCAFVDIRPNPAAAQFLRNRGGCP
jgi:hypothetical protein